LLDNESAIIFDRMRQNTCFIQDKTSIDRSKLCDSFVFEMNKEQTRRLIQQQSNYIDISQT
jgi:hypothetical protein